MRTRREPKPPRPPRIIAARLVVVALVVGVVLAVGSVVVGAIVPSMGVTYKRPPDFARHFETDGHLVVIGRSDGRMATLWEIHSMPQEYPGMHRILVRQWEASPAASARWPKRGRTPLDGYYREQFVERAGWPLRCAYATGVVEQHGFLFYDPPVLQFLFASRERTIPVLPLWPGLLGNTLFYAMLALTPIALLRWRTLRRRARRELCAACGYELGAGISACPECGLAKRGP